MTRRLCRAVVIRRLSVPRWVRNGTETPVVLDCEYVYNENDLKLVVKWFFNDGPEPVYQWIPEMRAREAFGVLQGRLDDTFSVNSRDVYSQYRAIRIVEPTWELSGKYTCVVASLAGQDSRHKDMTVFVPAKSFSFDYSSATTPFDEQPPIVRGGYLRVRVGDPVQQLRIDTQDEHRARAHVGSLWFFEGVLHACSFGFVHRLELKHLFHIKCALKGSKRREASGSRGLRNP
ncbi:hypothetical protein V5799_026922 [Amblyomma americanum]|uniref:Ig-like domain-containing protein n=1 Tax=Amblyomma americanum TaxID=6943 RepID=A0AAQ4DH71_AMBAM